MYNLQRSFLGAAVLLSAVLVLAAGVETRAQTGPGGVGNSDGSGGQPRNVLWLRGDRGITYSDDSVDLWEDQSGNANHAAGAGATRPTYVAPDGSLNNLPYINYPATGSGLRLVVADADNLDGSSGLSHFMVFEPLTQAGTVGLLGKRVSSGPVNHSYYFERGVRRLRSYVSGSAQIQTGNIISAGTPEITSMIFLNVNNGHSVYQRGQSRATGNGSAAVPATASDLYIGTYDGSSTANFDGKISEVILFQTNLNTTQRQIIENYLSAKYSRSLNTGDVYTGDDAGNGHYDFDVFGIGRTSASDTHTEAGSEGLYFSNPSGMGNGEWLLAGHNGTANAVSTANLGAGVEQRWARAWYIDKSGGLDFDITFDFGEGIGGQSPTLKDNYVLLREYSGTFEIVAIADSDKSLSDDRITFRVADALLSDGVYTLGTTDATQSPVDGTSRRTWYSYQSGNWSDANSWTLDGSLTPLFVNPGSDVPAASDLVVITSGRTITADVNNINIYNLQVTGTLDVAATSGHDFTAISGEGRIRLSGAAGADNFPAGNTAQFADSVSGGTVELYGTGISLNQDRTFNHLIVNLSAATASLLANYTLYGDLEIQSGTFRINDNAAATARTISVYGDVLVSSGTQITVGSANARHQFDFYGNLTVEGSLAFTNRVAANYTAEATDGIVDANFLSGVKDQYVWCNGPGTFYRIEINKGVDDTYKLSLTASNASNFNLYGYANENHGSTAQLADNANAIGLIFGTVEIGTNIDVPVLNNTGNYNISAGAALWVNGGSVTKPNGTAIVPYGKIRVSAGTLAAPINSGITLRDNGTIIVDGGTLTARQIRTSVLGAGNVGGYVQSGGSVTVDGTGGVSNDYSVFSLTYPGNVFNMSGGTLTVRGAITGTGGLRGAIFIASDPTNVSITGGTVVMEINNNTVYRVTTTAPFWSAVMRKTGGTATNIELTGATSGTSGAETVLAAQPMVLYNDLTIENGVNFVTNNQNLTYSGSFEIQNGATYTPGSNTTTIRGIGVSSLNFGNTTVTQEWNNLTIDREQETAIVRIVSGNATALRLNGELRLQSGNFDYNGYIVSARGSVYVADTIGTAAAAGKLLLDGTAAQTITSSNGRIYNLDLNNTNGISLAGGGLRILKTLTLSNGVFDINTRRLTLDGAAASIAGSGFGTGKMIQTSGNASDEGLEMYFDAPETILFPIGTNANATVRYTPVMAALQNYSDDGYLRITTEDDVLQTTLLTAGPDILSYNWRVHHSGFSTLPTVSYQFVYAESDVGGTEGNYVPGKVLGSSPFTRSSEESTDINTGTNVLTFNGSSTSGLFPGNGFALEDAAYTAGIAARFTGTPRVFYTRRFGDGAAISWRDATIWTLATLDIDSNGTVDPDEVHDSRQPAISDYPKAGDIAVVGWAPWDDPQATWRGKPHGVAMNTTESCAELRFTQMLDGSGNPTARVYAYNFQFRPTVVINNLGGANVGQIASGANVSGEGAFWIRSTGGNLSDPTFSGVDLGAFNAQDSSYFIYENTLATATYANVPAEFPNLMMATDGWGANDKSSTIEKDITVNGDLELLGDVNLVLGTGATGNITVKRNLRFFRSNANGNDSGGGSELRFANSGTARTITVEGDLLLGNGYDALIYILSADGSPITHTFNLHGDFLQNTTAGDGFKAGNNSANDRIHVNLMGAEAMVLQATAGDVPQFYSLTVNKGSSTATTATFNSRVTIDGPTNLAAKSLVLQNGLLILNHASTNISLSTGGGSFSIPSTAGLEVQAGTVSVTGSDTGILLDGLLRVSGGTVNVDDAANNGNNFIEYSSSGSARLEISSGTLTVGSHIRRSTANVSGVLKYNQSGGTVLIGRRALPLTTRGAFEILNAGSAMTMTGGSLTLVRGINSTSVPSLWLEPQSVSLSGSTITIGNASTPAGVNSQNIGIKSTVALENLAIAGANNPVVKIYVLPLSLSGSLSIGSGTTFDAMGLGLNIAGDMTVDGTFTSSSNLTTLNPSGSSTVSGSTAALEFYDLRTSGSGTVNLGRTITVNRLLQLSSGIFADQGYTVLLKGHAEVDAEHQSTGGEGLLFQGSAQQQLRRSASGTGTIGILTIDNANGVVIPDGNGYNFDITGGLRLSRGVFDIGGSLVSLGVNADIEDVRAFGIGNMVQTNSSFTDLGLRKFFPAGSATNFTFPVGESAYTPVVFSITETGTGSPSVTVRPANERHPVIVEDAENPNPEIVDIDNVLQYYWIINADNVSSDFAGTMTLQYEESMVAVTAPYSEADYIAARILSDDNPTNLINKFTTASVNETTNIISISFAGVTDAGISGDYFAGVDDAIPNAVATYTTVRNGNVDEGGPGGVYDQEVPGGGTPTGSVLIVDTGDELIFNIDNVSLYKTEIRAGGTLTVDATRGHRLGVLSGEGMLKLVSNTTSATLPAADYATFFDCSGGGLTYAGSGNYTVMSGITSIRNLAIEGSGTKSLSTNDITVCEDLRVDGPLFRNPSNRRITVQGDLLMQSGTFETGGHGSRPLTVQGDFIQTDGTFSCTTSGAKYFNGHFSLSGGIFNAGSAGLVRIRGNMSRTAGTFNGGSGTVKVTFAGTSAQTITGSFSGADAFHRLEIDNAQGLSLSGGDVDIITGLLLTDGLITPGANRLTLLEGATVTPVEGQAGSYVNGRLYKELTSGQSFIFPIGASGLWRYGSVLNTSAGPHTWYMQYYRNPATIEPLVDNLTASNPLILRISSQEYWKVGDGNGAPSGTNAQIGLSWGTESMVSANGTEREAMEVMVWNDGNSNWDEYGGTAYSAGHTQAQGYFTSAAAVSFSEKIVTLGSTESANPLPVTWLYFKGWNAGFVNELEWKTASEKNNDRFEIERSGDGRNFELIGIVAGNGTTDQPVVYRWADNTPLRGNNYYRLRQVDYDGAFEYSNIIRIRQEANGNEQALIVPNPSKQRDEVFIALQDGTGGQEVEVSVADMRGRLLHSFAAEIGADGRIGIPQEISGTLKRGLYAVTIASPEGRLSVKWVVR